MSLPTSRTQKKTTTLDLFYAIIRSLLNSVCNRHPQIVMTTVIFVTVAVKNSHISVFSVLLQDITHKLIALKKSHKKCP